MAQRRGLLPAPPSPPGLTLWKARLQLGQLTPVGGFTCEGEGDEQAAGGTTTKQNNQTV